MRNLPSSFIIILLLCPGCTDPVSDVSTTHDTIEPSIAWEQFRSSVYQEPWEGGAFVVDGNIRLSGEDELREFYDNWVDQETGLPNLALGKEASQSSTFSTAIAPRAVDGNTDGNWNAGSVTATRYEPEGWWQVDLGYTADIGTVVLYNRTDCCQERLTKFDILVSHNAETWEMVASYDGEALTRVGFAMRTRGRYVRVQSHLYDHLSLAEVQVFPPRNLALGKSATQSSTSLDANASRAVDGNTDGDFSHHSVTLTNNQPNAWWQVDLGVVTGIGEVVLYNRTDCCEERLSNFAIFLSEDGSSWHQAVAHSGHVHERKAFLLNKFARFVRVQLLGANNLSLAEVKVFAPVNLAYAKFAEQTSTQYGGAASRAVDGNVDGDWNASSVTHTRHETAGWFVDLGAVNEFQAVALYNRTDCCSERLKDFDVVISNDFVNWTTISTQLTAAPTRTLIPFPSSARYLGVVLHGPNYLSLAEVELWQ